MATTTLKSAILLLIACLNFVTTAGSTNTAKETSRDSTFTDASTLPPGIVTIIANSGSPLCLPTEVQYWVYIDGCPGPYTITLWINGNFVTVTSAVSPYTFSLVVSSTTTVVLMSVSSPGCNNITITLPNIITITVPNPTVATISGSTQVCQGGNGAVLPVSFTGNGPFTFTYRANNIIQPAITTSSNPYLLNVNPAVTTVYQLNDVSNPNCSGTVSLQPATVTVISPPTAVLAGDLTFCDHADTTLLVDLGGSGPYQLVYAINGVAQPPQPATDPYLIPVHTDTNEVYQLISVQNAACAVAANGQASITIQSTPSDTNFLIRCDPVNNSYTVEFDIIDAHGPITFTAGSGILSGVHFTSEPIHQSLNYAFVFHDSIDCQNVTVAGPTVCFCVSSADSLLFQTDTIRTCVGDTITALYHGLPTLDGDDSLRFILHTTPGLPVGQILDWNTEPTFGFVPGMFTDTIYYISAVVGDYIGPDSIDLADICLSVAPGVPVLFHALPIAVLGTDLTICVGNPAILPVTFSGSPPFSLAYAIDDVAQPVLNNLSTNPYDLNLLLSDSASITLLNISDQHCSAPAVDTLAVTVHFIPQMDQLSYSCDAFTTTYSISFEIQGGLEPWTVNGISGTLTGSIFTSLPIASGQPYTLFLSDINACGTSQASDTITCPCYSDAGEMVDTSAIKLCPGDIANALHDGTQLLDQTDIFLFVLHTDPGPGLGTILATAPAPSFAFDPASMQFGVTYYISAVVGNAAASGQIDLADPCLSIAVGTPVIWNEAPTAAMSGSFDLCPGQLQPLEITFTGQSPYQLDYTENGVAYSILASADTFLLNPALFQSATFQLVSVSDANCSGTAQGQVDITVHPIPEINGVTLYCHPDNLHYSVAFDVLNADLASVNINAGLLGNYDPSTGHFMSLEANLPVSYTFIVSDTWSCGQDTIAVTPDCPCITDAGAMGADTLPLCAGEMAQALHNGAEVLDTMDLLLFVMHDGPGPSLGAVLATAVTPNFNFDPALMQYGTTYFISAIAGNPASNGGVDLTDPCLSISGSTPVVWHLRPTADLNGDFDICPGAAQPLGITFTGQAPYSFTYTENGVPVTILSMSDAYFLNTALGQSGTFVPVDIQDAHCPGAVSGQATITVHPTPQIVQATQICDPDNLHYWVSFDVQNADLSSVQITSGLAGNYDPATGHFSSVAADLPNTYTFFAVDGWMCSQDSLVMMPDCPCVTDAGILSQLPIDVCFGSDLLFPAVTNQFLDAFDTSLYVICSNPADLPQSILFQSDIPQFAFSPLFQPGSTYYVIGIAGNPLLNGSIDFGDPCLSMTSALPISIHALPTASLHTDTTLCFGSDFTVPVSWTGDSPITFSYTLNNLLQNSITTIQNPFSLPVQDITVMHQFQLMSVQDQYCTGTVSGVATLDIRNLPLVTLSGNDSICPGETAILNLALEHGTSCSFDLVATPGNIQHFSGMGNGSNIPVAPAQSTIYSLSDVKVQNNDCAPIQTGTGKVELAPVSILASPSNYNGWGISCFGADDGFANASITGGFVPVELAWSTSDHSNTISNLPPGNYTITVTDAEGCTDATEVVISTPEPLQASWTTVDIDCRPGSTGAVLINAVQEGVAPYHVQINDQGALPVVGLPQTIQGLPAGPVSIVITDANGCMIDGADTIFNPTALSVDLGPDQTLFWGDSILLTGLISGNPPVSFHWMPLDGLHLPDQLSTWVSPLQTTTYILTVEDAAGCTSADDITIQFQKSRRVYLPNVIKPGADHSNGIFTVYGGLEVSKVKYMAIFDRWGEQLFIAKDFLPNDPALGWDGTWRGKDMQPGVYVYMVEVAFKDGENEFYKGSVTIVR